MGVIKMEKLEYQEKDGKVFCPLVNKWLVAKPEEKVRQHYICILANEYGYALVEDISTHIKTCYNRNNYYNLSFCEYLTMRHGHMPNSLLRLTKKKQNFSMLILPFSLKNCKKLSQCLLPKMWTMPRR